MSILDEQIDNKIQIDAENGVDRQCRLSCNSYRFTSALDAMYFCTKIQNWLYDHSIYQQTWNKEDINIKIRENIQKEFESGVYPTYMAQYLEDMHIEYWNPIHKVNMIYIMQQPEIASSPESTSVVCNMNSMVINQPYVNIVISNPIGTGFTQPQKLNYIVSWSNPATLILRNVTEFPPELGRWDGRFFHWRIPVEKVYINQSPNIEQRILDLPYVQTFEENGWIEY